MSEVVRFLLAELLIPLILTGCVVAAIVVVTVHVWRRFDKREFVSAHPVQQAAPQQCAYCIAGVYHTEHEGARRIDECGQSYPCAHRAHNPAENHPGAVR